MIPGFFVAAGRHSPPVPIEQTPFYSGDLITTPGWEPVTWPGAIYDPATNRTLVAWQFVGAGGHKGARVAAFDHSAGLWSRPHTAGTFYLPNDDHGHPALVRDAEGYIHCFFGSHNNAQGWSVTASPDDISTWRPMPVISGGEYTYPKPVLVAGGLYLFMRDRLKNMGIVVRTMAPAGGAGAWGPASHLLSFGGNTRAYMTEPHLVGTVIHFACMYADGPDSIRRGVYYFVYDPADGSLSNHDGSVVVDAIDLPLGPTAANAGFRIYDHGTDDGDVPSLQFDTLGNAHVLFADGVSPDYDLKHMVLADGSWDPPVVIAEIEDQAPAFGFVDVYALVPGADGKMEAWYNVAGDRVRRVRDSNGTWDAPEVIATPENFVFGRGVSVKGGHPTFRTTISERAPSANDSSAGHIGLFAHGDGGFIGAKIPESDDSYWESVSLLIDAGATGSSAAIDSSKSALPVSFVGSSLVSSDAPFAGARSIQTGSGSYFTVPQSDVISTAGDGDFCLEVWFKLDEAPGRIQVIASSRTSGFSLMANENGRLQFLTWSGSTVRVNLIGSDSITSGQWYLASAQRRGGECSLYLDGVLQASAVQSGPPGIGVAPVNFGRDPQQTGRHLVGWICEPRFTRSARYEGSFAPPSGPWPR